MIGSARWRWSWWARQDSNLRPLGDQPAVYLGCNTPTDQARQGSTVYPGVPESTSKTDDNLTVDHDRRWLSTLHPDRSLGQRLLDTTVAYMVAAVWCVPTLVQARADRKAGAR